MPASSLGFRVLKPFRFSYLGRYAPLVLVLGPSRFLVFRKVQVAGESILLDAFLGMS